MKHYTLHVIGGEVYAEARRTHPTHRPDLVHVRSVDQANDRQTIDRQIEGLRAHADDLERQAAGVVAAVERWRVVRDSYKPNTEPGVVARAPREHDDTGAALPADPRP